MDHADDRGVDTEVLESWEHDEIERFADALPPFGTIQDAKAAELLIIWLPRGGIHEEFVASGRSRAGNRTE